MTSIRAILLAAMAVGLPNVALAQPPPVDVSPATPARWEVTGLLGWSAASRPGTPPGSDRWYGAAGVGGSAAVYFLPHLKSEVGITSSREARVFGTIAPSPGQPSPIFRVEEHYLRTSAATIGVQYQFGENQWIHPFVGAGLEIARERDRVEVPPQFVPGRGGTSVALPAEPRRTTTIVSVRPALSTGVKLYVNERAFVRTDVQTAFGRDRVTHLEWRGGIGVEF